MATALQGAPDELITFDEAAAILDIGVLSVSQLVKRGRLHSVAHPTDRRKRLLSRQEVEARARFRAKHSHGVKRPRVETPPLPPRPSLAELLGAEPEQVIAGEAAGIILIALLLLATGDNTSPVIRGLMLGGIAALGIAVIAELHAQGQINEAERERLERLAHAAEANPEPLISELKLRIMPSGPAA